MTKKKKARKPRALAIGKDFTTKVFVSLCKYPFKPLIWLEGDCNFTPGEAKQLRRKIDEFLKWAEQE